MQEKIELKTGKISGKDLAKWFGISYGSYRISKQKKLEELKLFANFYEEGGKVIITEVFTPYYNKQQSKIKREVLSRIDKVWSEDGLDSCSRVGNRIYNILGGEDPNFNRAESTIQKYTREGRNELYGVPFQGGGKLGKCIYIWCKRDKETGNYQLLSEEEQEIKSELQTKYFGDATEKQILVKAMVESGELKKEDAWDMLEELTNMKTGGFMMFLAELQKRLGCQVVKGTLVERALSFTDNNNQ